MNNVIKLGLILTAIGVVSTLIYRYVIGFAFLFSMKGAGIGLVISIFVLIFLGRKLLRDPDGERLGYGEAVKKLFLANLISLVIGIVFSTLMFGNNTEMKEAFTNYEIEMQESAAKWAASIAGQSEAEQEAVVEKLREARESGEIKGSSYPYAWSQFPVSLFSGAIVYLLLSLLIALFVREKETQYA